MASKSRIKKITLSTTAVDDVFLFGMTNLENVTITKTVKSLPSGAFHNFIKLEKIFISPHSQLSKIPEYCFSNCESLLSFVIPESVVSIGEKAFRGCKKINQIEILPTVEFVDSTAFDGWTEEQRIFHYRPLVLSEKCKARLIDISEEENKRERIITHESDLTLKKYIVTVKAGHVGRTHYIPLKFPVEASSKKEAAKIAREIPRVKHNHKDAILSVIPVTDQEFINQINENRLDLFLNIKSKYQQKPIQDIIDQRKVVETGNSGFKRRKK